MDKHLRLKTLENDSKRVFKNTSKNGDWVNFSCPIAPFSPDHKYTYDKSPSAGATISPTGKVVWHCFTCKGAGLLTNLLRYLETKQKISYAEIIQRLEDSEELPAYENRFYCEQVEPCTPLEFPDIFEEIDKYPDAFKYILNRGISLVTAKKLGMQYDPDNFRIVFPVKDFKGNIYGFTGRTILPDGKPKIKDYYFPKSQFILGIEHWVPTQPSIIIEGLFGFAHLHEVVKGKYFPYNIGAIMGSSASTTQVETLIKFGKPVYVLLDNDKAGRAGMFGRPSKFLQEGLIHDLKDQLPTIVSKWPKEMIMVENREIIREKTDPDQLTYDEVYAMLQKSSLVL